MWRAVLVAMLATAWATAAQAARVGPWELCAGTGPAGLHDCRPVAGPREVDPQGRERYPHTLFAAEESFQGACTAKSTIFTANIAAGLMLEQFTRWLRRLPVDPDLQFNLLSSEITLGIAPA